MRESFVFHSDFIDHLPEELKIEWAMYCINYGLYEKEPKFNDVLHAELWRKLKDRIDADRATYEQKLNYTTLYNEYKKLLKSGDIPKDTTFENFKTLKDFKSFKNFKNFENFENNLKISTDTRREFDSEFVSVSDSEFVSEYEYDSVSVSDAPNKASPSQINYSKELFNLFKDAGLPCSKGNEISFLQTDFKNALNYLHKTSEYQHITSDDVIGAVRNYIEVLNDESSYVSTKMNFFSLVKSKMFYNLLPSNFDVNNFKDWNAKTEKKETEEDSIQTDREYQECPSCHEVMMYYHRKKQRYICCSCLKYFDRNMKEVDG